MSARNFLLGCLVLCFASAYAAQPSPEELRKQAERCRRLLRESVLNFYLPGCLDHHNGGYKENLQGKEFVLTGEKFLTLQARHLWLFSTLALEGFEREAALAAARHGYRFIEPKFRDPLHGGYFSKVTDSGEPKDSRKHAYLNSFVLYGLVAYSRASGDGEALRAAQELFRTLEGKAHDRQFSGYVEFFERDWTPLSDPQAQGYVGAIGHKTYNTHLHLLESYAELYRAWPEEQVRQRLAELLTINISTVRFPTVNNNVDAFEGNWTMVRTPRNLRASYGHDLECIWLVWDAADTLGWSRSLLLSWGRALADTCLEYGYDPKHGGFYNGGALGKPADDRKKTWWVQTEALLGLLDLYRQTGEEKFYDAFRRTLDFCEQHQIAREGGWWAVRNEDGSATADLTRTSPWQGGYHTGRALIFAAKWLEALAARPQH